MSARGVLRDAAFRRLWAGMTVSKLGSSVAGIATPLIAVQVLDASAFTVSLLTAAAWLPWLLVGLPAGAWIDRVAKRPVMLACDAAAALLVASVPLAAWLYHLTIGHLLGVALLVGVASVFFQVAWTAYLPAMFEADDLVGANSVLQGSESAVQIAGPAIGGALIATVNAVAGLLVDALTFAVSAVSLLLIRRPERRPIPEPVGLAADPAAPVVASARSSSVPEPAAPATPARSSFVARPAAPPTSARSSFEPRLAAPAHSSSAPASAASRSADTREFPARHPARRSIGRDIAEGVRWLAREPLLRSLTLHGAAGNIALTGYGAIIVVFLVRDIGVSTATVGLLMAASGLGGVAAATATPFLVRRFGAARTMVRAKVGAGLASLLIPLTGPGYGLIAFVAGTVLVAACVVGGNVVAGSFRQTYVPPALLGRVVTGMQFVNLGAIPLGALLGGTVAAALGTRGAIWCMTIFYACAGLILLLGPWRGRRDLPAPAPRTATRSAAELTPTA